MGCGCFPDRKKDDEFEHIASKPLIEIPRTLTTTHNQEESEPLTNSGSCNFNTCKYIERIIHSLKYYQAIDIIKHQKEFITFVSEKYTSSINDFQHLLIVHENDIANIYNKLLKKYDILPCAIHKCSMLQRNQLDLDREVINYDIDDDPIANIELTFWIRLFDDIHCLLLHSFDYGYLTNINVRHDIIFEINENKELEGDEAFYITSKDITKQFNDCSDPLFTELKQHIIKRKKRLVKMNVAERHPCKYNILFPNHEQKQMDCKESQSEPLDFRFVGLKFYYWDHYKNRDAYVEKKYENAKEEVLNNTVYRLSKVQYDIGQRITQKLFESQYAKQLRAEFIKDRHYGIEKGCCIKLNHVAAMILYCNHDILAGHLLKTFYGQRANEQLFSIKKRHQEFRNWSMLLREAVEYFGVNTTELGSCYVGCKYIIVPAISVRLRAPISTSKHLSVVLRFLNDMNNGMIVELGANQYHSTAYELKGFPCHWLSNFSGESEVVLMGGKHTMKICSIRNVKMTVNYGIYFKAIYYFDLMLMGVEISHKEANEISRNDYELLDAIITRQLTTTSNRNLFGSQINKNQDKHIEYMVNMFEFYSNDKQQIVINLVFINKYYPILKRLIISERIQNVMLFNHIGLLFPNVTEIGIHAATDECKIDLVELFQEISKPNCKNIQKIQIRCKHSAHGSWLSNSWNTDIEFKFNTQKFKGKFVWNDAEDIVNLSRRKKNKFRKRSLT